MEGRKIRGVLLRTTFRDEKSGYSYEMVRTKTELMTLSGVMSAYPPGIPFEAEVVPDKRDLFAVVRFNETTESFEISEIERFLVELTKDDVRLSSATIKKMLQIVSQGKNLFECLDQIDPDSKNERRLIDETLCIPRCQRLFREYLQELSPENKIDYMLANKYVRDNLNLATMYLRKKPCQICVRELGMSFKKADEIAKKLGTGSEEDRLAALSITLLDKIEKYGSTCMSLEDMKKKIQEELYHVDGRALNTYHIEKSLAYNNYIVSKDGVVAFGRTLRSEEMISDRLRALLSHRRELFDVDELTSAIEKIEKDDNIHYADAQKAAFKLLRCTGLGVLTGGPGTGKTTVLKGLLKAYLSKYPLAEVVMASPTGRAAQRMTESTGHEAMTIHRLVGIGRTQRGETQVPGDIIIIDESSMLDSEMCAWLLMAISEKSLVLFVGDIDQLPSVGPGNVLKDLISSRIVPVCRLATVFRQSGESPIVANANKINTGNTDLITDESFVIKTVKSDSAILDEMRQTVVDAMKDVKDAVYGIQVLATAYKCEISIDAANTILQELINPKRPNKKSIKFGSREYREGDKVITTVNNYEDNYFNGDIGVITHINDDAVEVKLNDRTVKVKRRNLREMSLGYCISIHKSQGSEFEHAIIILPKEPSSMLRRNLLYTAVTRAKKRCTIVSSGDTIDKCCHNVDNTKRVTYLSALLSK